MPNFDLIAFIDRHLTQNVSEIGIKVMEQYGKQGAYLLEQLRIHQKALYKLPAFAAVYCEYTQRSYEQATSEAVACYKASLFTGEKMLDLSAGLGVDDWAFSKSFKKIIALDIDGELNRIASDNYARLGVSNIERITADAEQYFDECDETFSMIYIDADRRTANNKRLIKLDEMSPNVLHLFPKLQQHAHEVLLKLSPLFDLREIVKLIPSATDIYVIAEADEVKELLVLSSASKSKDNKQIRLHAVEVLNKNVFSASLKNEVAIDKALVFEDKYFFVPHAALIKAELALAYAEQFKFKQVDKQTLYFTSNELPQIIFGKCYRLLQVIDFSKSAIKKYLKDRQIHQANIARKNFPMKTEAIRNLFQLKDGGDEYLFFAGKSGADRRMYHCKKIGV